jgi:hypothetical protein
MASCGSPAAPVRRGKWGKQWRHVARRPGISREAGTHHGALATARRVGVARVDDGEVLKWGAMVTKGSCSTPMMRGR